MEFNFLKYYKNKLELNFLEVEKYAVAIS